MQLSGHGRAAAVPSLNSIFRPACSDLVRASSSSFSFTSNPCTLWPSSAQSRHSVPVLQPTSRTAQTLSLRPF